MKQRIRKTLGVLLSVALIMACMPIAYAEEAAASSESGIVLLDETFENYKEGDFYSQYSDYWQWSVLKDETKKLKGDKIEIVTDTDGNKSIQFTRAEADMSNTATALGTLIKLKKPVNSGSLKVEYDMELVNNRGAVNGLWATGTEDGKLSNRTGIHRDTMYFENNKSGRKTTNKHKYHVSRTINYGTSKVVIVVTDLTDNKEFYNATLPMNTSSEGVVTTEVLRFQIQCATKNFPFTNDSTGDGVYKFDNIKATYIETPDETLFSEDFTDFTTGDFKAQLSDTQKWAVDAITDGDSVTVAEVDGDKKLKLVRKEDNLSTTNKTTVTALFDKAVSSGIIKLSFELTSENNRGGLNHVLSVNDYAKSRTTNQVFFNQNTLYTYRSNTDGSGANIGTYKTPVIIEKYINLKTGAYKYIAYSNGEKIGNAVDWSDGKTALAGEAGSLKINAQLVSKGSSQSRVTTHNTGDGVWYFDNIRVDYFYTPDIIWTTPNDRQNNVEVNSDILIKTAVNLEASSVNTDNVKVYTDYENLTLAEGYTVSVDNGTNIKIHFENGMKYATEYTVTVNGIQCANTLLTTLDEEYKFSFTTEAKLAFLNEKLTTGITDNKMIYSADLKNNGFESAIPWQFIASAGKNLNILNSGTLNKGKSSKITIEMDKPESGDFSKMLWESFSNMKPLTLKENLTVPGNRTYGYDNYIDSSKPLNVAFIGGSITQQGKYTTPLATATTTTSYLDALLKEDNADREVNYKVAGIGGTGSSLGLYRLDKDVIDFNPDIVFIEFAVNDGGTAEANAELARAQTEGMFRKLMNLQHQPMVILLYMPQISGSQDYSIDAWETEIYDGKSLVDAYGVASIDVGAYIKQNIASEENPNRIYVWKSADESTYPNATALTNTDGVHPNKDGGQIYADYINTCLTQNPEKYFKKMNMVSEPLSSEYKFVNPTMVSWRQATYTGDWTLTDSYSNAFGDGMVTSKTAGSTVTFKFTGNKIGIYGLKGNIHSGLTYVIDAGTDNEMSGTVGEESGGETTGSVDDNNAVEEEVSGRFNFYNSGFANMPMACGLITLEEGGEHTITFTVVSRGEITDVSFGYFMIDN